MKGERSDDPRERAAAGPAWLERVPEWLYRSAERRVVHRQRPYTASRVRTDRWRALLSLSLLAAWITFTLTVLHTSSAAFVGGFAGAVAVARYQSWHRWKQLLGLAPPDADHH